MAGGLAGAGCPGLGQGLLELVERASWEEKSCAVPLWTPPTSLTRGRYYMDVAESEKKEGREELKPGSMQAHLARTPLSPDLRSATSPEAVAVCSPSEHEVACTSTLAC